jgi:hypothetical protein
MSKAVFEMRGRMGTVVVAVVAALTSACATLDLPSRFLVVEQAPGEVKAFTPDEAKVWLRDFEEPGGDLAFWAEALEKDLVDNRGYVLLSKGDVKDGGGTAGRELVLETQAYGTPVRYLIAVFVHQTLFGTARIRTVEYLADKKLFDTYVVDVRAAIAKQK